MLAVSRMIFCNVSCNLNFAFRNGVYPLTAYDSNGKNPVPVAPVNCSDSGTLSTERKNIEASSGEAPCSSTSTPAIDRETRKVINMMCNVKPKDGESELMVFYLLQIGITSQKMVLFMAFCSFTDHDSFKNGR